MVEGMGSTEGGALPTPLLLDEAALMRVLEALRIARGLDFRQYRTTTIRRRLERRMAVVRASDVEEYLRLLFSHPAEYDDLIDYLTLKVSAFFRDARTFDLLGQVVVPELIVHASQEGRGVLSWSAGCATGEEVYSLAMLFLGHGDEVGVPVTPLVIGTDIDERALIAARTGTYSVARLQDVTREILERWFEPTGSTEDVWRLCQRVQAVASFQPHDLVAECEAPPTDLGGRLFDLVVCRNVLIYMQRPLQLAVLARLDRCLIPGGYMVLGEAESLPESFKSAYDAIDRRARIFRKRAPNDVARFS